VIVMAVHVMMMVMPVPMMMIRLKGFRREPALHVMAFRRRVIEPRIEQAFGIDYAVRHWDHRRGRIEHSQPRFHGCAFAVCRQVRLPLIFHTEIDGWLDDRPVFAADRG
jgi:hypothetical protein